MPETGNGAADCALPETDLGWTRGAERPQRTSAICTRSIRYKTPPEGLQYSEQEGKVMANAWLAEKKAISNSETKALSHGNERSCFERNEYLTYELEEFRAS